MRKKLILISSSFLLLASCKYTVPSVSHPTPASAKIGTYDYNCGYKSPVEMTTTGQGTILLTVTNEETIQFYQKVTYRPNNFNSPTITLQNGTGSTNYQKLTYVDRIDFDVPFNGNYKIRAYFIEYGSTAPSYSETGNTTSCFNPMSGKCYRWTKQMLFNEGDVPQYSSYSTFIDTEDPDGFVGNCN